MKKLIILLLVMVAFCFAASTEKCNPNPNADPNAPSVNYDPNLPIGWCRAEGFVCGVTTESSGGVRFSLGKNSNCKKTEMETTIFDWHPVNSDGSVNTSIVSTVLAPYLEEGPIDNVSAVTFAVNTAFIINALRVPLKITPKPPFTNKLTFTILNLVTKRGFLYGPAQLFRPERQT